MARRRDTTRPALRGPGGTAYLTSRQYEVLQLAARGLGSKEIAAHLGISRRTVEDRFDEMRKRAGIHTKPELLARAGETGLVQQTSNALPLSSQGAVNADQQRRTAQSLESTFSWQKTDGLLVEPPTKTQQEVSRNAVSLDCDRLQNTVRVGYATHGQNDQAQFDALGDASCYEIVLETISICGGRPELRRILDLLRDGDTLVIYEPDRIAQSVDELMILLEYQLRPCGIRLQVLSGAFAGLHDPNGVTIAKKMLFWLAEMTATLKNEMFSDGTSDGSVAYGEDQRGRPRVVDQEMLDIARDRQKQGASVTDIARELGVGRSTLYRALKPSCHRQPEVT